MGEITAFAFFGVMFWIIVAPICDGQPSMTRGGIRWLPFALVALLLVTLLLVVLQSQPLVHVFPGRKH